MKKDVQAFFIDNQTLEINVFIIIKRIQTDITLEEIENFVLPVIKTEFASRHGALKSIQIFDLATKKGEVVERHALVRIGPDSIVIPLIKLLSHASLHNQRLSIDQYFIRHWRNDRRSNKAQHTPYIHNQRKQLERRRRSLDKIVIFEKIYVHPPEKERPIE